MGHGARGSDLNGTGVIQLDTFCSVPIELFDPIPSLEEGRFACGWMMSMAAAVVGVC